jgi:hypothetical protein
MSEAILVRGADKIEATLKRKALRIQSQKNRAALAAAKVLVPFVKQALPRGKEKASPYHKPGYLRSHVKAYEEPGTGIVSNVGVAKVKLTGHEAHLVYGDTKQHEIDPRGLQDAQVHSIVGGRHLQGPMLLKSALSWSGANHPSARAIRPAHRGAPSPLPEVLAEHRPEAALAAKEVIGGF